MYNIGWYCMPLPKIFAASGGQGGGGIKPAVVGGGMVFGSRGGVSQHIPLRAPMYGVSAIKTRNEREREEKCKRENRIMQRRSSEW